MNSLTPFEFRLKEVLEAFEEALDYSGLSYAPGALRRFGFADEAAIQRAMNRSIQICRSLDINPRKHFRYHFKADLDSKQAFREWKISRIGFYLLIFNGEPSNPYTCRLQMEMLRKMLP